MRLPLYAAWKRLNAQLHCIQVSYVQMQSLTRRHLIEGLACSGFGAYSGPKFLHSSQMQGSGSEKATFLDILRAPDFVTAFCGLDQPIQLSRSRMQWTGTGLLVATIPQHDGLPISVSATTARPTHIHLRWSASVKPSPLVLGDAWERSYGDLHWEPLVPERVLPWYFLTSDRESLHGYGVKTGAGALCFWQIDPQGISLWLNLSNGGNGVVLDERELLAATVVTRQGERGENALDAARFFCRRMCDTPRSTATIYGSNDWYYSYGRNTADQIVRDAELMTSLAPTHGPRPFTVIDDGWKNKRSYPDMAALCAKIRSHNVRPGLWIRPLQADADTPADLLLPNARFGNQINRKADLAFDPTVPEALVRVLAKVKEASGWGYELIKHDYSTYDLLGQWGSEMHAQPTLSGWSFHDRSKTNAEIIRGLYEAIREAAGERTLLIGCNTVGHLGAGIFDAQRTGDDVSGQIWERTRRMGVNTLAFRLPQHRAFFALDADCVPITTETPWSCNQQWLDLVARSGSVLFVSPQPAAMGPEQREAVREAFEIATSGAETIATDWQNNTTPAHWQFRPVVERNYDWYQNSGAWPFGI
jgi:alpha-galactosidase